MKIRKLRAEDHGQWLRLRRTLWPESDDNDAERWLSRADAVTFTAEDAPGELIGFVEAGERAYADGCNSSPVLFLEGWYVDSLARRRGIGGELLRAAEDWARARNLTECASDALLDNAAAIAVHASAGFHEVERSVKFRKPLS